MELWQNIFMKKLLIPLVAIMISACASRSLNTWIGKSEDQLVSSWGIPTSTYKLKNGSKLIEYRLTNLCTYTFTVKANGIVTKWRPKGGGCSPF